MKKIIFIMFLMSIVKTYSQNYLTQAKQELESQQKVFAVIEDRYKKQEEQRKKISVTNVADYDAIIKELRVTVMELDKAYDLKKKTMDYYDARGVSMDSLSTYFPDTDYKPIGIALPESSANTPDTANGKQTYIVFGDNTVIKESSLTNNTDVKKILSEVISQKSESYLGDFEIPAHMQKIELYKDSNSKRKPTGKYLYFERTEISLREGGIHDIRITLTNIDNTKKYYFVNTIPISLLRYMIVSSNNFLSNKANASAEKNVLPDNTYIDNNYYIKMSDVLRYYNNTGSNFVPEDKSFTFPPEKDKDSTANALRIYKVIQDTGLRNVVELRTYTDFLGLFNNNTPNGLVQFEGRADFYLAPFQVHSGFPMTLFKKTTPYINFARIDEDLKDVTIQSAGDNPELFRIKRPLEVIEKAYLDMGIVTDIVGFSFTKDFPFSTNIYIPVRYKVSEIEFEDETEDNFKTLGVGLGIRLEIKRFNNFGFTHSTEWTKFNHITRIDNLAIPENFLVFRNESEIFYYPGESKQQSIFLRLRSYLDKKDKEDSFFQLQFGYRFSIGI